MKSAGDSHSPKRGPGRPPKSEPSSRRQLSLTVSPELHQRIRVAAAIRDCSITDYVISALEQALAVGKDEYGEDKHGNEGLSRVAICDGRGQEK